MGSKLFLLTFFTFQALLNTYSQNIFSGERVMVVGSMNGYATNPYGADYRTTTYRRLSVTSGTPTDGRGQWATTINVQNAGGDITPVNMPGGGGNGFLFISGPDANRFQNKWVFAGVGQGAIDVINDITCYNCGNDMGFDMNTTGYYTFVFNDCGYTQTDARYYAGYTSSAPVTVSRNSISLNANGGATITINTSAAPSAQEKIYVRYTTGADFAGAGTSSIVQATGSGTSWTAIIPDQTVGVTVRYFIFTSTRTIVSADPEADKSISALQYDDNSGNNYLYVASLLPVRFTSITGNTGNGKAVIKWTIAEEGNIARYELEKSVNGISFNTIETVSATNGNAYSATDNTINKGNNYYRVKAVNTDGGPVYSKTILLVNGIADNILQVFPVPVKDQVNIRMTTLPKDNYQMKIINTTGQVVYEKLISHDGADKIVPVSLPVSFAKGVYQLSLTNGIERWRRQIIIE